MRYLFEEWDKLKEDISNKHIFLFLDYDGTLTPIVKNPNKAIMPKSTKGLLKELLKIPECRLAIISGRALEDIKNKVGLRDIIYSGNHGLEIEGPKIRFKSPIPVSFRIVLGEIKEQLTERLSLIKGHILEDKGLSLALHYRLVDKKYIPLVKVIFHEIGLPYKVAKKVKIRSGKMVLEIKPPIDWDKGKVVLWLLARQQFELGGKQVLPIYIGDDITDEDAFKALKNKGLTIFVGRPAVSEASYYLKNTQEVTDFMKQILGVKAT